MKFFACDWRLKRRLRPAAGCGRRWQEAFRLWYSMCDCLKEGAFVLVFKWFLKPFHFSLVVFSFFSCFGRHDHIWRANTRWPISEDYPAFSLCFNNDKIFLCTIHGHHARLVKSSGARSVKRQGYFPVQAHVSKRKRSNLPPPSLLKSRRRFWLCWKPETEMLLSSNKRFSWCHVMFADGLEL